MQQWGFCRALLSGHWHWRIARAVALSWHWRKHPGVGGEGLDNQLEGREEGREEGGEGRATCSRTSSEGDDGGLAATMSSDPPTPCVTATAAVYREALVSMLDQTAGMDVMILAMRSRIRRERGSQARLMQQLARLNVAIKTLQRVQEALRTAVGGDSGDKDGDIRGVGATIAGGGMENLKESVRRTVDRHKELGA